MIIIKYNARLTDPAGLRFDPANMLCWGNVTVTGIVIRDDYANRGETQVSITCEADRTVTLETLKDGLVQAFGQARERDLTITIRIKKNGHMIVNVTKNDEILD